MAMLHAYPPAHNAGAEWMVHTMLRALVERDHEVDVVLSNPVAGGSYELDGVRVHPFRSKHDPFDYTDRADAIITHLENTQRASMIGQMRGIPVVHVLHNTFPQTKNWLRKGPCSLAVYNSQWMRTDFETWLNSVNTPRPNSVVIHPPVLADEYRTKHGDRVTLINLFKPKGSETFWRLAERMPDVEFLAVTGGYGDQDIRDLPNVEVLSNLPGDRMRDEVYARTKLLLMPSDYESWGRVGVEGMVSGIPVIAHPTPGLQESLGDAGVFVDRNDLDGWEKEIRRLLAPRAYGAASKRAIARAAELDPAEDLTRWCDAIEALAAQRGRLRALARL
ncbi:glycosyltransferase family 4 protein [Streptosporangium sp. NPDC050855]|uniref:glycosyltransferase family 4 protein n=1 Tax=Streptosporangium sp. NPDC050855 TaxID=3366194 RepID=UPI0037AC2F7D